jgi:hypothetical protein
VLLVDPPVGTRDEPPLRAHSFPVKPVVSPNAHEAAVCCFVANLGETPQTVVPVALKYVDLLAQFAQLFPDNVPHCAPSPKSCWGGLVGAAVTRIVTS